MDMLLMKCLPSGTGCRMRSAGVIVGVTLSVRKRVNRKPLLRCLALIGSLYAHEKIIRKEHHEGAAKRAYRQQHSTPIVAAFFDWCREQCYRNDLLPKEFVGEGDPVWREIEKRH